MKLHHRIWNLNYTSRQASIHYAHGCSQYLYLSLTILYISSSLLTTSCLHIAMQSGIHGEFLRTMNVRLSKITLQFLNMFHITDLPRSPMSSSRRWGPSRQNRFPRMKLHLSQKLECSLFCLVWQYIYPLFQHFSVLMMDLAFTSENNIARIQKCFNSLKDTIAGRSKATP